MCYRSEIILLKEYQWQRRKVNFRLILSVSVRTVKVYNASPRLESEEQSLAKMLIPGPKSLPSLPSQPFPKTGGPYITLTKLKEIIHLSAKACRAINPVLVASVLTEHSVTSKIWPFRNVCFAKDKEVYIIMLRGEFHYRSRKEAAKS